MLAARRAAKGRVAREAVSGAFQLSRGNRNRGSISVAMKLDVAMVRGTESLDCCEKSVAVQVERLVCRAQFKQRSERIGLRRVRGSFMIGCVLCKLHGVLRKQGPIALHWCLDPKKKRWTLLTLYPTLLLLHGRFGRSRLFDKPYH